MQAPFRVRLATEADLPAIDEIYDHYVLHDTCTFQTVPSTKSERAAWFAAHDARHPVTVAEAHDGSILGWGSLSVWNPRQAYARTVEDSVYVRATHHRRGLGRALLEDLLRRATELGHHTVIAVVTQDQHASVGVHRALGFEVGGALRQLGWKFDRWIDVSYLQKML